MSRQESLIISEELFIALSPVSGDIDWQYVWPLILATQDEWIQPIIGQKLYEKIMADIDAAALIDPYKLLLEDYIARVCVWFTCYVGLPFWAIKIVNSGVVQRVTDDGTTVAFNDIDKLREQCREKGEFYKQRLIDYLCANSKDFPEFRTEKSEEVSPEVTNYSGGLNLEPYLKKGGYSNYYKNRGWL